MSFYKIFLKFNNDFEYVTKTSELYLSYLIRRFGGVKTEVGSIFIERKIDCGFKNHGEGPSVADCFLKKNSFFVDHDESYCRQHSDTVTGNVLGVVCDNTFKNES